MCLYMKTDCRIEFRDFAEFLIWVPTAKTAAENSRDIARNNITSCYKV